ncbi:hypothetical protein TNCT_285201 [Trichonephila clavata]|uniref:Uncharacterized protein n=1 Tax=Trichonephila clavata TaxID=2740835 RepID=A0A8X6G472_TRICU|nr:hypothetical protein TNCT_285201 [Trichonephila clavata]
MSKEAGFYNESAISSSIIPLDGIHSIWNLELAHNLSINLKIDISTLSPTSFQLVQHLPVDRGIGVCQYPSAFKTRFSKIVNIVKTPFKIN